MLTLYSVVNDTKNFKKVQILVSASTNALSNIIVHQSSVICIKYVTVRLDGPEFDKHSSDCYVRVSIQGTG